MNGEKKSYANGTMTRSEMIDALGRHGVEGLGAGSHPPPGLEWVSMPQAPEFFVSGISRHQVLAALHAKLRPRTYLEIGVNKGASLQLSRAKTIAVDPNYRITCPISCDLATFLTTSDDFFDLPNAFDHFGGVPVDLAFIDGMHLAEFALRDFMNTEKRSHPGTIVVLDDMLPRSALEAYRIRRTRASWTGDVFKVHMVLSKYRPDLTLIPINSASTGSYLVLGLDPSNRVLDEAYPQYEPFLTSKDPQTVPEDWLRRKGTYNAEALLNSDAWSDWVNVRESGGNASDYAPLILRLSQVAVDNLPPEDDGVESVANIEKDAEKAFAAKNWSLALEKYCAIPDIGGNPNKTSLLKNMFHARLKRLPKDSSQIGESHAADLVNQMSLNIRHEVATQLTAPMAIGDVAKKLSPTAIIWASYLHNESSPDVKFLDRVLSGHYRDGSPSEIGEIVSSLTTRNNLSWEWWLFAYARLLRLGYAEAAYEAKDVAAQLIQCSGYADGSLVAAAKSYLDNQAEAPLRSPMAGSSKEDSAFLELIAGKTVSVVGPAVNEMKNGEMIDSADLVVRTNFIATPAFYAQRSMLGSRTDVTYYNLVGFWRRVSDIAETLRRTPLKAGAFRSPASRRRAAREAPGLLARYAPLAPDIFFGRGYALRHLVFDLLRFNPRGIVCFGADFYLSDEVHAKGYNDAIDKNVAGNYVVHDPLDTWLFLRRSRRDLGLKADAVLDSILDMDRKDFVRAIGARVNPSIYD